MRYVQRYWENSDVLHVNCEKPRAYFIPFSCSDKGDCDSGQRELSDYFFPLKRRLEF